jgi:hypothetical protein
MKKLFVCFLAVALVFAFTAPTMAADWNFYGNTRFQTFSQTVDNVAPADDDTDTVWLMQNNSRFGGKVAAGDIAGHIEVSAASVSSGSTDNIGLRHLTGTWNFGAGTLLVGHTWAVITNLLSNAAANQGFGMLGYGSIYQGRRDQIRLTFGGLKIGLLAPAHAAGTTFTGAENDTTLPKVEVAYRFATDMFWVEPYVGYNSFDQGTGVGTQTEAITSMIYGFKGKVNIGPAFIGAGFAMGTNPADYGLAGSKINAVWDGATVQDVDYMEYMVNVGFKMSDMVTFEGGYGRSINEIDVAGTKVEDPSFSYYIQADITLAPGVHLIPEYAQISEDDVTTGGTSVDEASTSYIGAKWQINF